MVVSAKNGLCLSSVPSGSAALHVHDAAELSGPALSPATAANVAADASGLPNDAPADDEASWAREPDPGNPHPRVPWAVPQLSPEPPAEDENANSAELPSAVPPVPWSSAATGHQQTVHVPSQPP